MPRVTLRFGNNDLGTWEVYDQQPVVVGRSPECTIHIDNPGVSRRHCQIEKRGDFCVVSDMGSNNGTFHNGKKVTTANLNNGDEIAVGKHLLIFMDENAPAGGMPAPGADPVAAPGGEEAGGDFGPNTMMIDMNRQVTTSKEKRGHLTIKSKKAEQTVMLRKPEYIIGKAASCDIIVKGMGVSKKHAVIIRCPEGFKVIDVSDKKPTLVNKIPVDRTILNKGDVIKIAGNEFSFYQED